MSPRCKKPRRCSCPFHGVSERTFRPVGMPLHCLEQTRLNHDELETMYLCDSEGLTQQEAGSRMGVSRGTVQRMLAAARKKVVNALVKGAVISIETEMANEN